MCSAVVVLLALCCALAIAAEALEPTLESGSAREENAFAASAYPVKWSGKTGPPATEENAFVVSAYPVKWSGKGEPPAMEENAFSASAYPVKWSGRSAPLASEQNDFDVSAYPVKWSGKGEPPAMEENALSVSAYPVKWSGRSEPPASGFDVSAYPVKWSGKGEPLAAQEFNASAYPVKWSGKAEPPVAEGSSQRSFSARGYPVRSIPSNPASSHAPARRHQIKVQTGMLFLKKSMHVGAVLPEGTMFARAVVPQNPFAAPLESQNLAAILSRFKIPESSVKAKQVADTLRSCSEESHKGEPHMCFASRVAMARFATGALGVSRTRAAITRIHGLETTSSRYVVAQISLISKHVVPCHAMPFPYEVFYCHRPREVLSLRVQLKGLEDGRLGVTAVVICHMNTSDWDKQYFELLGGERSDPICHYMPDNYIMFY